MAKGSSWMPVTLRVPLWFLESWCCWYEALGEMYSWKWLLSSWWAVREDSPFGYSCFCQAMWSHSEPGHGSTLHVGLSLAFENLPEKLLQRWKYLFDITFDRVCQVELIMWFGDAKTQGPIYVFELYQHTTPEKHWETQPKHTKIHCSARY